MNKACIASPSEPRANEEHSAEAKREKHASDGLRGVSWYNLRVPGRGRFWRGVVAAIPRRFFCVLHLSLVSLVS